jgi:hypothetical protein
MTSIEARALMSAPRSRRSAAASTFPNSAATCSSVAPARVSLRRAVRPKSSSAKRARDRGRGARGACRRDRGADRELEEYCVGFRLPRQPATPRTPEADVSASRCRSGSRGQHQDTSRPVARNSGRRRDRAASRVRPRRRFAGSEDHGKVPAPPRIAVRPILNQQFHHRNAKSDHSSAHERAVSSLVHIGTVINDPSGNLEARWARCLPADAALGHPRKGAVSPVSERSGNERPDCATSSVESNRDHWHRWPA